MYINNNEIVALMAAAIFHRAAEPVCPADDFRIYDSNTTGIGTNTYMKCERCKRVYDVTDYGAW